MLKKIFALALAALMIISVVGCGETEENTKDETKKSNATVETPAVDEKETQDEEQQPATEEPEAEEPVIDEPETTPEPEVEETVIGNEKLAGVWLCTSGSFGYQYFPNKDGSDSTIGTFDITFTYDSMGYGNLIKKLFGINGELSVNVDGNKIEFLGVEEKDLDLQIEYELSTCSDKLSERYDVNEDFIKYFENPANRDNCLKLHITGTYSDTPTSTNTIDTVIEYVKDYHQEEICARNVRESNWVDNSGNKWHFYELFGKDNFTLVDNNGDRYTGFFEFTVWQDDEFGMIPGLSIAYDNADELQLNIVSVSHDRIEATKVQDGSSFVLTRE